jgi:hypothetical protein
LISFLPEI